MSRRKFSKDFKEAAIRRLELGSSIAEVSRACEVNLNVLPLFLLAGFQPSLIGRFWVSPEAKRVLTSEVG